MKYIYDTEFFGNENAVPKKGDKTRQIEALEYIAKIAEGGMRDAISLMDKCISFSNDLTLENVVKALGTVDYEVMMDLTDAIITKNKKMIVRIIENIYSNGKDIKQFISQYVKFLLDVQKYSIECSKYMQIPMIGENKDWLESMEEEDFEVCLDLLSDIIKLNSSIKWSQSPKYDLEAVLLLFVSEDE